MSSSILFFSRRFFGSHNCKLIRNWKVFPSILANNWAILFLCTSCDASVVLGKQLRWRMVIQRLLLCRVLSKGSKVGIRNFYLATSEYFSTWDYAF